MDLNSLFFIQLFSTCMIEKDLQEIGLQEKEAKVYLASLELGQATVQQIAAKADIKRPTTYFIIEGLMSRGLVSSFYQGKKQYFIAENPERLMEMLQRQKQEISLREERFKTLLPQLSSINNRHKDKPVVKYYEGKEGIVSMVSEHVKTSRGQEICSFYSRDAVESMVDSKELQQMVKDRLNQNIKARALYTWSKGELPAVSNTERVRLNEEELPINCDVAIFDDKVRIASFKDRVVGVVIEDKEIARAFKALYEMAWNWVKHSRDIK